VDSAADFGVGMRDGSEWSFPPFEMPEDFTERINQRVQAAMERAQSHLEAANRHAETAGQRASIKIEAAMRRAEAKARAPKCVPGAPGQHPVGRWNWSDPHGPVQTSAPVSDDERLTILKCCKKRRFPWKKPRNCWRRWKEVKK